MAIKNSSESKRRANATLEAGLGPSYSLTEFGFDVHLAIIGFDNGRELVEIADLLTGVVGIDTRGDDF